MKKTIRQLSFAFLILSLSTSALAVSSPFRVTVPNQQGGFTFGADILYLRPTAANLSYNLTDLAIRLVDPTSTLPINSSTINPHYEWGFDAMLGYRIPCTGNDITFSWTHLGETDNSASISRTVNVNSAGVSLPAELFANATVKFSYDAADLDFGQRVNFGDYFNFRLFTGLRGVRLQQKKNTHDHAIFKSSHIPFFEDDLHQQSTFRGIGPQFGLEGRYCLGYGFGLDANSTLSALVGRTGSSLDTQFSILPTTADEENDLKLSSENKTRVVPALDATLGLDYTYNFNFDSRSSVVIQAGYKVIHYWNVSHMIFSNIGPNIANNISFDGPYFGLKINI